MEAVRKMLADAQQFSVRKLMWVMLEMGALFGALLFTLPYVPSHQMDLLPLLPGAGFAVVLFVISRFIRWRKPAIVAIEAVGFAAFVWGANEVSNLIYHPY